MASKLVFKQNQFILQRLNLNACEIKAFLSSNENKSKDTHVPEEVTKESLQWRTSWDQHPGSWYSKFKIFASDHNNTDLIRFLQSPIDFRPSTIKNWYQNKQEEIERQMQQYLPERNQILGDNLAAAHFLVFRGGAVKFHGELDWIKQNEELEYKLPNRYVPGKIIQAIDCSDVKLFYEGLENFRGLDNIEWLKLKNCTEMDDWCLDRISGMFRNSIQYLDIRGCSNITERGIGALYKTTKLKTLLIDDIYANKSLELTCLMLQELIPNLNITTKE